VALAKSAGRSIKRTLQPRKPQIRQVLLGEPDGRDKPVERTGYSPSLYGMDEGQRPQGSKGNEHLRRTRGKDDGMLRKSKEVEPEARTVSVFSKADSQAAKASCISCEVTAGAGVGQVLK
jgi:hypothetical protein